MTLLIRKFIFCSLLTFTLLVINSLHASANAEQSTQVNSVESLNEKVNLALRRTADELLRLSGDSTSRIPPIEQLSEHIWRIQLDQDFQYSFLPSTLQSSLDQYGIKWTYEVAVRNCTDSTISLGYHQYDFLNRNNVPCSNRVMPEGCHYIDITFLNSANSSFWLSKTMIFIILIGGIFGLWFFTRKRSVASEDLNEKLSEWLDVGHCQLDLVNHVLICGKERQNLTFRESKLLGIFAQNPNRLLERDFIIQQVWADEGVLVGRSVDVFVSRLRKKLAADSTVGIVAVHGVGYRLETGK
ncbi:MAG: winged helix-turn-helix domain-containing protein [Saprospiraceae bacterium]